MISNEILIVVISSVAGLIGYLIREWQNRFRPFISIVSFGGDIFLNDTKIILSPDITKKTEKTFYIDRLTEKTNLRNINRACEDADYLSRKVPEIICQIDEFIGALKNNESHLTIFRSLENLFRTDHTDRLVRLLLINGKIPIQKMTRNENEYIYELSESTQISGGCYVLSYEGNTLFIGTNFQEDAHNKDIFKPLIQMLRVVDKNNIISTFEIIKNEINSELIVANSIYTELQNIIHNNSQWETELFIANLKRTPLLLENTAIIHVADKTGATFHEECEMIIREKNADGKIVKKPSKFPIIISNGEYVTISYSTKKSQKEMERGDDFRNAFIKRQAKAWLTLSMLGVGLIKKRTYKTDKKVFAE